MMRKAFLLIVPCVFWVTAPAWAITPRPPTGVGSASTAASTKDTAAGEKTKDAAATAKTKKDKGSTTGAISPKSTSKP